MGQLGRVRSSRELMRREWGSGRLAPVEPLEGFDNVGIQVANTLGVDMRRDGAGAQVLRRRDGSQGSEGDDSAGSPCRGRYDCRPGDRLARARAREVERLRGPCLEARVDDGDARDLEDLD